MRSISLALLALLATIFVLNWARAIFIPLMLGVVISYALTPLVSQLRKWRIPRAIGAAVLLLSILGGTGSLVYSLSDDATKLIETLPDAVYKFRVARLKERVTTAGVLKTIPYLGPVVVCAGTALVAFFQFGRIDMVLLVSGTSLIITSLEGYLLTPWLTGRANRMRPGGGVCQRAGLGLVVGRVGPIAGRAHHDDHQGGLRSCGRVKADWRTA